MSLPAVAGATLIGSAAVGRRWRGGGGGGGGGCSSRAAAPSHCSSSSGAAAAVGAGAVGSEPVSPQQALALLRARQTTFAKDFLPAGTPGAPHVTDDELRQMLEAATWAPTHRLTEPWRFVVIRGDSKRRFEDLTVDLVGRGLPEGDKRDAALAKLGRKRAKDWPRASCYVALCMQRHEDAVPEWEELCAVAAAAQNLHLQATALGVACGWSSWQAAARDAPEMAALLGLDPSRGDRCLGVFVCGRGDPERVAAARRRRAPLEAKVAWLE